MFYTWEENSILKLSDFEQNINDSLDDSNYLDFFVFCQKKKKNLHSRPAVSTNHDALNTIFVIWYQKSTAEPLLAGSTVLLKSVPEKSRQILPDKNYVNCLI